MFRIAIASGKGGTGKTFISTNIFWSLRENNVSARLVDCDAEAPNAVPFFDAEPETEDEVTQQVPVIDSDICTFCGKCHDYCTYNAIFILPHVKLIQVIEDLCHDCGACYYACEYGALTEKSVPLGKVAHFSCRGERSLTEARMNIGVLSPVKLIQRAVKTSDNNREFMILDSPPGTSCPFVQTVSASDYVILVTEPTPFGLSDLRQSVDTLRGIGKPFGVIINRSGIGNDSVLAYLQEQKIELLLEIPFSRRIAELYSEGKIAAETDTSLSSSLFEIAMNIRSLYGNSSNQR